MEENNATSTKTDTPTSVAGEKWANKKTILIIVIISLIAITGVAFGIIELMQASKKNDQIIYLNQQLESCTRTGDNNSTTEKTEANCPNNEAAWTVSNIVDNELAQMIADPYLVFFGAFDNIFDHDFDMNAKMKITFDNLGASYINTTKTTAEAAYVRYDDLNNKLKYLFGSDQEIEKRSYEHTYTNFVYIDGDPYGHFEISINGVGGTGGTMFSIVKEAHYDNDNLIISVYHDSVAWCETIEDGNNDGYCVDAYSGAKSDNIYNLIKEFSDRIPVYTMTFAEDNHHYVLRDIQKQ